MHACLVIPEQPRKGFILGLADGFEALTVKPFHFQRGQTGFRWAALSQQFPLRLIEAVMPYSWSTAELIAGVLAAAIAMEDQPCLFIRNAQRPGHLQRIDDQVAPHLRLHRPAHHTTTEQIDDYSQKQPALVGGQWSERPDVVELSSGLSSPNRTCTFQRIRLSVQVLLIAKTRSA